MKETELDEFRQELVVRLTAKLIENAKLILETAKNGNGAELMCALDDTILALREEREIARVRFRVEYVSVRPGIASVPPSPSALPVNIPPPPRIPIEAETASKRENVTIPFRPGPKTPSK
ncbi:MAG: hypothetical protein ABIO72_05445 [Patescibacteria group bacterium]